MAEPVAPALAPRAPWRKWNAWSGIALFKEGPFRWVKTHSYLPARRRRGYPLALAGGFNQDPDSSWMGGPRGSGFPVHHPDSARPQLLTGGLTLHHGGWSWDTGQVAIRGLLSGRETSLLGTRMGAPMVWVDSSRLLVYRSHSIYWQLQWGAEQWEGVGLVEHAHGGYFPVPLLLPLGRWHWDLLWDEEGPLQVGLNGNLLGIGVPLGAFVAGQGAVRRVRGAEIELQSTRDGLPFEWTGQMDQEYYHARRVGRPLRPFQGAACFAFSWFSGARRGIGFTQCGGNPVTIARRPEAAPHPALSPQG